MTTVADHIARRLHAAGARHAFGIPGGEVLAVMDALARAGIAFHLVKHETAGGFMADAVAQLTGTPGVLVGTIGPGVTNLVTAVAHAYPQYQLSRDPTCTGCHISPSGGGQLDENGLMVAASTATYGGKAEFMYGKLDPPSWLLLGGDLRGAAGQEDRVGRVRQRARLAQLRGRADRLCASDRHDRRRAP